MAAAKPDILITGASGFIGGRVSEVLCLTGMATVRAGIHRWTGSGLARLARLPVAIVPCDVLDPAQVAEALAGVDVVIHCVLGDYHTNVEGTRHLLDAARRHGVARVVFLSSAEVYRARSGIVDETAPCCPASHSYSGSKTTGEELCWDAAAQGLPVTVLRPSIVYGPFSEIWIVRFAQRLLSGQWHTFHGFGDGICNLIYVDDLVRGIWLAATRDEAIGQAFNLNGPEIVTWNDFFRRFNATLDQPPLTEQGAASALGRAATMEVARRALVAVKNHLAEPIKTRLLGGPRKTRLGAVAAQAQTSVRATPSLYELRHLFSRQAVFDDAKARRMLGYTPQYDLDQGLALCAAWLAHHQYIRAFGRVA